MKRKQTAVSDEALIAALLQNKTIQEAAQAAGLSPRTVYDRMERADFRAAYNRSKAELLRGAVLATNGRLRAAIDCVAEIMNDTDINPAVRLQAAQTIINNSTKLLEKMTVIENTYNDDVMIMPCFIVDDV